MFATHRGDAILEWVVLGALVIAVVGVVAYTIAKNSNIQGFTVTDLISKISVPSAHPLSVRWHVFTLTSFFDSAMAVLCWK